MKTLINNQGQKINVEDCVYNDAVEWKKYGYKYMLADPEPSNDSIIKIPVQEFDLTII